MRDIPVFTTENGVASLILREIPYTGIAYIRVQSSLALPALAEECAEFCRCAGAKWVYAAGHPLLSAYPKHTEIWRMTCERARLPDTEARLFPVTASTLETFRQLYNRRMAGVPNAAFMTVEEGNRMLQKGDGYFVHRDRTLLGIGRASGDTIDAVISVVPGQGETVLLALNHALFGDTVGLEVASANLPAVRLYERLGFIKGKKLSVWYRIDEKSNGCQGKNLDKPAKM